MNTKNLQLQEQDQHLDEINDIVRQMDHQARNIQGEINVQKDLIEDMDHGMDKTMEKMSFVHKKLSVLLKTKDQSQLCMILVLTGTLMVLIFFTIFL
mmetsp:Transcript_50117/g.57667  ORF Transcript_50117/g.57667 Transcript_50117/m.57667 type:complete len:97 (+) Transcript_50117:32-322(+)